MTYSKKWCDDIPDREAGKKELKKKQRLITKAIWASIQERLELDLPNSLVSPKENKLYQINIYDPGVLKSIRKFCVAQRKKKPWWKRLFLYKYSTNITLENVHELNNYIRPYIDCLLEKGYRVYFSHEAGVVDDARLIINWLDD